MAKKSMTYFKLGTKASVFYDSSVKVKITKNSPASLEASKVTRKIRQAQGNGFLVEIKEEEFNEILAGVEAKTPVKPNKVEELEETQDFSKMSSEELDNEAETYLEGEELEEFKALTKKKKRDRLIELTTETE